MSDETIISEPDEFTSLEDALAAPSRHSFRRGAMISNASMPSNHFGQTVLSSRSTTSIAPEALNVSLDGDGIAKVSASIFDSPAMKKIADQLMMLDTSVLPAEPRDEKNGFDEEVYDAEEEEEEFEDIYASLTMPHHEALKEFERIADEVTRKFTTPLVPAPLVLPPKLQPRLVRASNSIALDSYTQDSRVSNVCVNEDCGAGLPIGAKFCPDCGAAQLAKFCIHCGAKFGDVMKFCPECGHRR